MKRFLLLLLQCIFFDSNAQIRNNDYYTLIDSAISLRIHKVSDTFGNLYLIDENNLPYLYLPIKASTQFKSLQIYDSKSKAILKKGINALKILPELKNNKFTVDLIDYKVSFKKGEYFFLNGGGVKVIFEYSCSEQKWALLEFKNIRN